MAERQHTVVGGVVTALATPVRADGALDRAALTRLVDHSVTGGVVGLACCGSTGEGARLSSEERLTVASVVAEVAPPETMVVGGLPISSVADGRRELEALGALGVTAVLVAPPSYYPADESELLGLYRELADGSPLPLLLYNMPRFTVALPVRVVAELAQHPMVVGIKDSSGDLAYLEAVLAARGQDGFMVYTGGDPLLVRSRLLGADGAITASANLVPRLVASVWATAGEDLEQARELQAQLTRIVDACGSAAFPSGWKAALHLADLCAATMVKPGGGLSAAQLAELDAALRDARALPSTSAI